MCVCVCVCVCRCVGVCVYLELRIDFTCFLKSKFDSNAATAFYCRFLNYYFKSSIGIRILDTTSADCAVGRPNNYTIWIFRTNLVHCC